MSIAKKILIHQDADIVVTRLQAREMAREIGFGTIDQARISLASGELARMLFQNGQGQGEIMISEANVNNSIGIQVVSTHLSRFEKAFEKAAETRLKSKESALNISSTLSLVDEYSLESHAGEGTQITLTKWL